MSAWTEYWVTLYTALASKIVYIYMNMVATIAGTNIINAIYIYTIRKAVMTPQRPQCPSSSGYIIAVCRHWSIMMARVAMASAQPHGSK